MRVERGVGTTEPTGDGGSVDGEVEGEGEGEGEGEDEEKGEGEGGVEWAAHLHRLQHGGGGGGDAAGADAAGDDGAEDDAPGGRVGSGGGGGGPSAARRAGEPRSTSAGGAAASAPAWPTIVLSPQASIFCTGLGSYCFVVERPRSFLRHAISTYQASIYFTGLALSRLGMRDLAGGLDALEVEMASHTRIRSRHH